MTRILKHRRIDLDGMSIFYREAGEPDAPAVLLPHGYPCSSYEFRNFIPALADRVPAAEVVLETQPDLVYAG